MNKLKDKRVLVVIGIVIVIIIALIIFFSLKKDKEKKIDTSKLDSSEIVEGQEEVTNLVRSYVESIDNIKEYAKDNSKIEFSVKELKGIFKIDTSEFNNLKYGCSDTKTFIKYDNDYNNYIVVIDCKDFYLN